MEAAAGVAGSKAHNTVCAAQAAERKQLLADMADAKIFKVAQGKEAGLKVHEKVWECDACRSRSESSCWAIWRTGSPS